MAPLIARDRFQARLHMTFAQALASPEMGLVPGGEAGLPRQELSCVLPHTEAKQDSQQVSGLHAPCPEGGGTGRGPSRQAAWTDHTHLNIHPHRHPRHRETQLHTQIPLERSKHMAAPTHTHAPSTRTVSAGTRLAHPLSYTNGVPGRVGGEPPPQLPQPLLWTPASRVDTQPGGASELRACLF